MSTGLYNGKKLNKNSGKENSTLLLNLATLAFSRVKTLTL